MRKSRSIRDVEWPTAALLAGCYGLWGLAVVFHDALGPILFLMAVPPLITLHSSLQHEAAHGHPTRFTRVNEALVFLPLGLAFPYRRFKALHLRHHNDAALTDPYDDPESFYYAMADWRRLPRLLQFVLDANNTFLGRITIGPAVMFCGFVGREIQLMLRGERDVVVAWTLHALGIAAVLAWAIAWGVPVWLYVAAAYLGLSLLNIRTFAEHQAHETPGGRTAIVESSPVFGLLFLNNNLHFVHHENPRVPWYELPKVYRAKRQAFLDANGSYSFKGYREVIARYFVRAKTPVPHPYLRRG